MLKKIWPFFLILVLSYFSLKPLLKPGFFTIHDSVHPQRVNQMEKAIRDLQIPPRWSPDLGYGYGWPQFSFYSPLPYYFGGLFSLITGDAMLATKLIFIIAIIFSAFFIYLLVSELFGILAGILAGIFYLYSPYHALDLYVRGALAECWGMMFIPLVLYFMIKMIRDKKEKWIILGGIAYASLILSHNLTALIFSIFLSASLLIYLLYLLKTKKSLLNVKCLLLFVALGLLLSIYFWLPALLESKYTYIKAMTGGRFGYRQHFIAFRQIWDSPWGYGASAGIFSGISYMVGKLHLIISGLTLLLGIINIKKNKRLSSLIFIAFSYLLIATFMTNIRSDFIWSFFSFLSFVQYPWRFLIFVTLITAFLGGVLIFSIKNNGQKTATAVILITLVILTNKDYFQPQKSLMVSQSDFLSEENLSKEGTKASEEYLPIWRPKKIVNPPKEVLAINDGSYKIIKRKVGYYQLMIEAKTNQEVVLNVSYFPGWQVVIDGKETNINYQKDGLIRFSSPIGKHEVVVSFSETKLRFLANSISAITFFLIIAYLMLKYTRLTRVCNSR